MPPTRRIPGKARNPSRRPRNYRPNEVLALSLWLLFRGLAPMRSRNDMPAAAEGVHAMEHEEATYWLDLAMHRKIPRRGLKTLRILLTTAPLKSKS